MLLGHIIGYDSTATGRIACQLLSTLSSGHPAPATLVAVPAPSGSPMPLPVTRRSADMRRLDMWRRMEEDSAVKRSLGEGRAQSG
jgi:hypothetical protein